MSQANLHTGYQDDTGGTKFDRVLQSISNRLKETGLGYLIEEDRERVTTNVMYDKTSMNILCFHLKTSVSPPWFLAR